MTTPLDDATIANISQYDGEQRFKYLLKTVKATGKIWILNDNDGCVMLNTDDEDCVPVWPDEAFAKAWATGEWQDCEPKSIEVDKWLNDWTVGLLDDDLSVAVFPIVDEQGIVVYADEFDHELRSKR